MKLRLVLGFLLSILLTPQSVFASGVCTDIVDPIRERPLEFRERLSKYQLEFEDTMELGDHRGITFFTLMNETITPELSRIAEEGFVIADKETVLAALDKVSPKVYKNTLSAAGSLLKLGKVAERLAGKQMTEEKLSEAIGNLKLGIVNKYGLSTFIALASGGGVAVRIDAENIYYNVNYGAAGQPRAERKGRSFGHGPEHKSDDASDKAYLTALEKHVRTEDPKPFFKSLFDILTNVDTRSFSEVTPLGQTVLTDFIAVYTAESHRHLLSNLKRHPWDAALLEVTMLGAFHSGQEAVKVMFGGTLTDTTRKQAPGGTPFETRKEQKASMVDWWQFSTNPDPQHRNRSGINITRGDFRLLGKEITDYMRENYPELVENVERHFEGIDTGGNLFAQVSDYLISYDRPRSFKHAKALTQDLVSFLEKVREEAQNITETIEEKQKRPRKRKSA